MDIAMARIFYLPEPRDFCEKPQRRHRFYPPRHRNIECDEHSECESISISALESWYNVRAERWEKESAAHSSPSATYLHKDYIAIIAKGVAYPRVIVPLILKRIPGTGADWFFALENITESNPAKNAEDFQNAFRAWCRWAKQRGLIKESDALPTT